VKGSLTKRGRHSWRYKFDAGTTTGKRETKYITLHGTRRQAQEEAAKIMASVATGTHVDPSTETVKAREIEILTPEQVQTVLATLHGRSLYPIVATALGTGLRRSELLALRWQDVDLDGAMLRVERALEQTKRGGLVFRQPKTRHGKRSVSLPPSTVTVLREHRVTQLEQRLTLSLGKASAGALVFATWDGSTRSPNALTKEWSLAMQRAGLTATLHSLRHTHASMLIASGLDVLTISRRLGHGSPAITLGVYGHLFKPDDRAAAIMEAALSGAK
jgi:integrase